MMVYFIAIRRAVWHHLYTPTYFILAQLYPTSHFNVLFHQLPNLCAWTCNLPDVNTVVAEMMCQKWLIVKVEWS